MAHSQVRAVVALVASMLFCLTGAEEQSLLTNARVTTPDSAINLAWTGNRNSVINGGFKSPIDLLQGNVFGTDDKEVQIDLGVSVTIASVFVCNCYFSDQVS